MVKRRILGVCWIVIYKIRILPLEIVCKIYTRLY